MIWNDAMQHIPLSAGRLPPPSSSDQLFIPFSHQDCKAKAITPSRLSVPVYWSCKIKVNETVVSVYGVKCIYGFAF